MFWSFEKDLGNFKNILEWFFEFGSLKIFENDFDFGLEVLKKFWNDFEKKNFWKNRNFKRNLIKKWI